MTVHIGEVHTDVVPAAAPGPAPAAGRGGPAGEAERAEELCAALDRARWLAGRVAAVGFDD
ncbi:hypothetical protein [Streptomyces rubellomurinus]|uniref:Uncharacterized protein n=1 Tax=Streptomyces rubellomurinus (strain ATCC 31215) TaxID=359131 RepID=A0A0F2TAZ9_STRR3|nr:hypothetical protein [Streptomyces rubellomurinus]KJS58902.1 hypothetical protein VM95_30345 [Streptomyces rubellomurinus]